MKPTPVTALVNTFEFEQAAKENLKPTLFQQIAGSDRRPFERITLRPRMMVDTRKLDLSCDLLGTRVIAPIIAQALDGWDRLVAGGGEVAVAQGSSEARTALITGSLVSAKTMQHAPAIVRVSGAGAANQAKQAADAGAKALLCGAAGLAALKQAGLPVIVSNIHSPAEATRAIGQGAAALLITKAVAGPHPMEVLGAIVDRVANKVPVLIGGDFRRGTDILMALAIGARAVVVTRPTAWGLAGYGADGVAAVFMLLQAELARNMAMCGKVNLAALDRTAIKIHT